MSVTACRHCGSDSAVRDSREYREFFYRRRRHCNVCGFRWTTVEISVEEFSQYVKFKNLAAEVARSSSKTPRPTRVAQAERSGDVSVPGVLISVPRAANSSGGRG